MKTTNITQFIVAIMLTVLFLACNSEEDMEPTRADQNAVQRVIEAGPASKTGSAGTVYYDEAIKLPGGRASADQQITRVDKKYITAGQWSNVFTTANSGWDYSALYKGQIYQYGAGEVQLYVYNNVNGWVYLGGTSGSGNPRNLTFQMRPGQTHYFWVYCSSGNVTFDAALYKVSGATELSASFPEPIIKDKNSSSPYATSLNAFKPPLNGQCTWGAYARVISLVASGFISQAEGDRMRAAFWGTSNRNAKNWPGMIGGYWFDTNKATLPLNMRRKGMLVVWAKGTYGHVAFLESVSADKKSYTISDFNWDEKGGYRTKTFQFEGGSDFLLGTYPQFYQLDVIK